MRLLNALCRDVRQRAGRLSARVSLGLGLGALVLSGCGGQVAGPSGTPTDDVQQVSGDVSAATATPSAAATIAFETFTDDVGSHASMETRALIRSARGYQSLFGHAAPAGVDFSREWVLFYSAGTKSTGGYAASFLAVLRAGRSLIAITRLQSPGTGCGTTQALTTPNVLIKFPAQTGTSAQFFKQDATADCGPNLCAVVQCQTGTTCDPATGKCLPAPVRCGGIAAIPCPGMGQCADDPNDGCDPKAGGADCGGICSCVENVLCAKDSKFDSSPSVCACVPVKPPVCGPVCDIYCEYGNVLDANGCPTCKCNPAPANSCAAVLCPAGTDCDPATGKCVPLPTDPCATVKCAAGTHCDSGKCVGDSVSCGGIAGRPCPGVGKCVDDPKDNCDPKAGGADCSGICTCVQNVACTTTSKFDSSPSVCACVSIGTAP